MMKTMRRKTYRNFLIVKNALMKQKGYSPEEASKLTHMVFENFECDKDYGGRSVEHWYDMILPKAEYEAGF